MNKRKKKINEMKGDRRVQREGGGGGKERGGRGVLYPTCDKNQNKKQKKIPCHAEEKKKKKITVMNGTAYSATTARGMLSNVTSHYTLSPNDNPNPILSLNLNPNPIPTPNPSPSPITLIPA